MKKLKKIYVDINGIILDKVTYYLVTFTKIYEYSLFGIVLKETKKIEEVPFVFKSYEIAKEFCELNPKYEKYTFSQTSSCDYHTKYNTYKLVLNEKVNAYIIWNYTMVSYSFLFAEFSPVEVYPVVSGFIKDELNNIVLPPSYNAIRDGRCTKTEHEVEKLSDIFAVAENDKHHFELVEK